MDGEGAVKRLPCFGPALSESGEDDALISRYQRLSQLDCCKSGNSFNRMQHSSEVIPVLGEV